MIINKTFCRLSSDILLLLGICSCTSDRLGVIDKPGKDAEDVHFIREMTATISDFIFDGDSNGGKESGIYQSTWTDDDAIGIFPEEGVQVALSVRSGAGEKQAVFARRGWGMEASHTYSAYAPLIYQADLEKENLPLKLTGQKQNGNHSPNHIPAFDYKVSLNNLVEDGKAEFLFKHYISILHLEFTMPGAGVFKNLILETNGRFISEATLNLTNGEVKATKVSAVQVLNLDNVEVDDFGNDKLEIYLAVMPVDLSTNTLTAKIYDKDGVCYTADLTGRKYEAGVIYNEEGTASTDILNTGLPLMLINTPGNVAVESRDEWLENASITLIAADGTVAYDDCSMQIKGRGNSTWEGNNPNSPNPPAKKPYSLKLDKKVELLGMPKHKRWVLLANFYDRTSIRNSVAFQIARCTNLDWTPRGEFLELVLNGRHVGGYYLCEQIKIDKNRVDIHKMESTDIDGDSVTGGYLMEMDARLKGINHFSSKYYNMPYNFKEPDDDLIISSQMEYMEDYVKEMESSLYDNTKFANRKFENYMDIDSYIDWWFVYELTQNNEPRQPAYGGKPLSCYAHKDRLGKMKMGPVWDFDVYTFTPNMPVNAFAIKTAIYYGRLFQDAAFVERVKQRWDLFKGDFSRIPDYMQSEADRVRASNTIDKKMWPNNIFRTNGDDDLSFDDAIAKMKTTYTSRFKWLDKSISSLSAGK